MLRSMFTAISSLSLHQEYLDVIANNLANSNTTGYKSSRVQFEDQFYQLLSAGAGPTDELGGINPKQIGLGQRMGYISPNFTQGMLQNTGRNMDLAIQGNGFFVYGQGANRVYSREGSLNLDSNGYLVNASNGLHVQGWKVSGSSQADTNLPVEDVQVEFGRTLARATTDTLMGGNLSSDTPVDDGNNSIVRSTIGVYDSLGNSQSVTIEYTRTEDYTWTWEVTAPAASTSNGELTFDANGKIQAIDPMPTITVPGSTATNPITFTFDVNNLTMLSGDNTVSIKTQDGLPTGTVSDIHIAEGDGSIYLVYSNGLQEKVAQLAMAYFNNPAGLIRTGSTGYKQGLNSGEVEIGTANSGGRGAVASGYLEASNVDMAQEFTNMILAQRGFQASSRVISTADEIMQELVNLKR
jgi:flagellar hook protein FlgE